MTLQETKQTYYELLSHLLLDVFGLKVESSVSVSLVQEDLRGDWASEREERNILGPGWVPWVRELAAEFKTHDSGEFAANALGQAVALPSAQHSLLPLIVTPGDEEFAPVMLKEGIHYPQSYSIYQIAEV